MPNRVLRDWTQSDKIDKVSCEAERFFARLIMKADDYGCFWADSRLLKANLYPLKLDKIREADIPRWMAECQKAGLIVLYEVGKKKYLQIQDFRQRLDKAKNKFPLPSDISISTSTDSLSIVTDFPAESEARNETETETEAGTPAQPPPQPSKEEIEFKQVQNWILQNAPTVAKMKEPLKIDQFVKLKERFPDSAFVGKIFLSMHNWKKLNQRQSAYLTFLSFAEKDQSKVA